MTARILVALAMLVVCGCATTPPFPAADADRYLEGLAGRGLLQGAVVIGRHDRVEYSRGFGLADVERGVPFTPATPSDGGSIAKTFTSAALHQLVEKGVVDLDAPVQRYLEEFPHAATRVRHLVSHSAGLPSYDWFDGLVPPPAVRTNADQLALIRAKDLAPAFIPGTRFAYDNVAFDVAVLLIERVTGERFADYLERELLAPAGITGAFLRPARLADFPGVRTRGYRRVGGRFEPFDALEGEGFHGGGNLYISASDLHRWASSFLHRPAVGGPTLERGLQRARLDDGREIGLTRLGWYRSSDGTRFYATGHHQGFYTFAYFDRVRGITIAFVTNSGVPPWLDTALPRALIALAEGRPPPETALVEGKDLPRSLAPERWRVESVGDIEVGSEAGAAWLRMPNGVDYRAFRVAPGHYFAPGVSTWLRFHERNGSRALLWDSVFHAAPARPRISP